MLCPFLFPLWGPSQQLSHHCPPPRSLGVVHVYQAPCLEYRVVGSGSTLGWEWCATACSQVKIAYTTLNGLLWPGMLGRLWSNPCDIFWRAIACSICLLLPSVGGSQPIPWLQAPSLVHYFLTNKHRTALDCDPSLCISLHQVIQQPLVMGHRMAAPLLLSSNCLCNNHVCEYPTKDHPSSMHMLDRKEIRWGHTSTQGVQSHEEVIQNSAQNSAPGPLDHSFYPSDPTLSLRVLTIPLFFNFFKRWKVNPWILRAPPGRMGSNS